MIFSHLSSEGRSQGSVQGCLVALCLHGSLFLHPGLDHDIDKQFMKMKKLSKSDGFYCSKINSDFLSLSKLSQPFKALLTIWTLFGEIKIYFRQLPGVWSNGSLLSGHPVFLTSFSRCLLSTSHVTLATSTLF